MAENDGPRRRTQFARLSCGWAIGSAEFKADLAGQFAGHEKRDTPFELLGADREAHKQARTEIGEKKLPRGPRRA